ncbi:hypothetical protein [Peribacillus sp. NPDC055009]
MNSPFEAQHNKAKEKDKNLFVRVREIKILKDAAVIVVLLTALSYFITYSFRSGYWSYYQLEDIAPIDIGPSDISMAISNVAMAIVFGLIVYVVITIVLWMSKVIISDLINPIAITIAAATTISMIYTGSIELYIIFEFCIIVAVFVGLKKFTESKSFKNIPLLPRVYNYLLSEVKQLFSIWSAFIPLKWIIIPIILFLIYATYETCYYLGSRIAEDKESYLIINHDSTVYVVIGEKKDNLIIAPVNLNKRIIEPKYSIIESKSNITSPLVLERTVIKGGFKVKNDK